MFLSLLLSSYLTFVELNCENMFDCRHDSLKNDVEYLPDSGAALDAVEVLAQTEQYFPGDCFVRHTGRRPLYQ